MKKITFIGIAFALPVVAFAQTTLGSILGVVRDLLNAVVPVLIVLAIIYFIVGVAKYIMSAGDEESQKGARNMIIYGIIAIFAIVSVWGLVAVLQSTFGVGGGGAQVPLLP